VTDAIDPPPLKLEPTRGPVALRRLLLFVAVAGLVLGLAAVRHGMLLRGRIDPDLVTTPDAAVVDAVAIAARIVLLLLIARLVLTARPWLRGVRHNLRLLSEHGFVGTTVAGADGSVRHLPGPDSPWLLLAPVPLPADSRWWVRGVTGSSRSAVVAFGFAALAVGIVAIGSLAVILAGSRDVASSMWLIVGVGAFLLVPAAGPLAWLVGDIDRREFAAICAADPRPLLPPDAEHRWAAAAIGGLVAIAFAVPVISLSIESERSCVATELECRWMVVQADQLSTDPRGATTDLHYGLWRATGARHGTMIIATGGPGVSGMAAWETSHAALDPWLTAAFDIVAFDARGVGQSGFRDCPDASEAYFDALGFDIDPSVVEGFVTSCLAESGVDPGRLAMYATAQVAEDIDTIREDLGLDRIVLYGESYGTAVAQRYALAHPDRLDVLILDGSVDIAQSTDAGWAEAAVAFESVLAQTLGACRLDDLCVRDLPDPDAAWRRTFAKLDAGPGTARYADSSGSMADFEVSRSDAIGAFTSGLYEEFGRSQLLYALAAADRDDWVPLSRLVSVGVDFLPYEDSLSDFTYYAASCADRVVGADDAADMGSYLAKARDSSLGSARLGSVFLSGAPCHAWPLAPAAPPPASLPASATFPVFVLTSGGDPVTPPAIGQRVAERYAETTDVYLIQTTNGPHVTFGRGDDCPVRAIIDFLVDGTAPRTHDVSCVGELVYPYTQLVVQEAGEDGATYRARALDTEVFIHPDYSAWDGTGELALGCRFGGRVLITSDANADQIKVQACAVVEDSPMDGSGQYRSDGSVRFDVTFPRGGFRYELTEDGGWELEGTFDGKAISDSD
jgi:pimeloyl-ACP methyl ester carboxylesterase